MIYIIGALLFWWLIGVVGILFAFWKEFHYEDAKYPNIWQCLCLSLSGPIVWLFIGITEYKYRKKKH